MLTENHIDSRRSERNSTHYTTHFSYILIFLWLAVFSSLLSPQQGEASWHKEIDATKEGFLETGQFGELQYGFTDVVPPSGLFQRYKANPAQSGYEWTLQGTELSVWQTADIPASARYLLNWRFVYEGSILEGMGRTGFIFGNPASLNLLSVEVTYAGSLRLIAWGKQGLDPHGTIVWSRRATDGGRGRVKIEAAYDIRNDRLTCRVNDGEPIAIEHRKYMPAPPMTIRGAGFFSAVPEARRNPGMFDRPFARDREIDMSRRMTRTQHTFLSITGE